MGLAISLRYTLAKLVYLVVAAFVLLCNPLFAKEPSTEPQLKIHDMMHTSTIRVIRHDVVNNRMVSISTDKTVRIWQLPSWKLVNAIYVPSEGINEGKLSALAVSPDGQSIAVAGWTGWDWDKVACIYIIDAQTGLIKKRVSQFKNTISYMAYSPDGKLLAVGLDATNKKGAELHILNSATYEPVMIDKEYGDIVIYVEFSPLNNTLVTTSYDGYMRVYNESQQLIIRQPLNVSQQLGGIRISPDGKMAVIGFQDKPFAYVVAIPSMELLSKLSVEDVSGQLGLCCIAWSRDGQYVYANGLNVSDSDTPIYRWDVKGFNNRVAISAAKQRISSMFPMSDGSLLYATEDPSFGVINAAGVRTQLITSPIINFKTKPEDFLVSEDGSVVQFPLDKNNQQLGYFSIEAFLYEQFNPKLAVPMKKAKNKVSKTLYQAMTKSKDWALANWELGSQQKPTLNQQPLPIYPNEQLRAYAINPVNQANMLLGSDWSLRLVDQKGAPIWDKQSYGVVWNVNISSNGAFAIASYSDGTIRWHSMKNGDEILALFPHKNGKDWVLWKPDGYYSSSENGDNYIGWLVNRGKDINPDFYRAVQFERIFYRPDLIKNVLVSSLIPPKANLASYNINELKKFAPPRIKLLSSKTIAEAKQAYLEIRFEVASESLPVKEYGIFINGIPVIQNKFRQISNDESFKFSRNFKIPINEHELELRIEAFNGKSMGLLETYLESKETLPLDKKLENGDLYVLAIGVNHFEKFKESSEMDLNFASQDALDVSKYFGQYTKSAYKHVHIKTLSDSEPTRTGSKSNILKALEFIEQANANDTVLVFLASHGFSDVEGNYYFLPSDGEENEVMRLIHGEQSVASEKSSLVKWQEIFEGLRKATGKRLLVVDTCQAKGANGNFDAHSLKKRSAASLFGLMVASQADESSQEYDTGQHGLFTFALLEALKGHADHNRDGFVTLEEQFGFIRQRVDELRDKSQPQTPDLIANPVLRETIFGVSAGQSSQVKVKLPSVNLCLQNAKSRAISITGECNN